MAESHYLQTVHWQNTVALLFKSISSIKYFCITSLSGTLTALVSRDSGEKKKKIQTKAQTALAQEPTAASRCWAFASHKIHKKLHCCRSWCIYLTVRFPNLKLVKYYTACKVPYGYSETKSTGQKHLSKEEYYLGSICGLKATFSSSTEAHWLVSSSKKSSNIDGSESTENELSE